MRRMDGYGGDGGGCGMIGDNETIVILAIAMLTFIAFVVWRVTK